MNESERDDDDKEEVKRNKELNGDDDVDSSFSAKGKEYKDE